MKHLKTIAALLVLLFVLSCEKETTTEELPINFNVEKDFDLEAALDQIELEYFNSKSTSLRIEEEEYICNGSFEDVIAENGGSKLYLFYGYAGTQVSIYV